jgi:LysR substrate binding domain
VLMMVAAGIGVSLAPSSVSSVYQPGVTFIPIQPEPFRLDLVCVRPAGEPPPTVAAFLDVLRQQLPRIRSEFADYQTVLMRLQATAPIQESPLPLKPDGEPPRGLH